MTITYEFEITTLCPNKPHPRNFYQARIESDHLIWTEHLEAFAMEQVELAQSQEDLTAHLAERFPDTAVTLTGQHGLVRITSRSSHAGDED